MLAQYPEVIPEILVQRRKGLQGTQVAAIQQKLTDKANECLGREMIFELVEYARVPTCYIFDAVEVLWLMESK